MKRRWLFALVGLTPVAAVAKPADPLERVTTLPPLVQPTRPIRYIVKLPEPPPIMVVGPVYDLDWQPGVGHHVHTVEARPPFEYIAPSMPEGTILAWAGEGDTPPPGWRFF